MCSRFVACVTSFRFVGATVWAHAMLLIVSTDVICFLLPFAWWCFTDLLCWLPVWPYLVQKLLCLYVRMCPTVFLFQMCQYPALLLWPLLYLTHPCSSNWPVALCAIGVSSVHSPVICEVVTYSTVSAFSYFSLSYTYRMLITFSFSYTYGILIRH